jgi:hypothetical protein
MKRILLGLVSLFVCMPAFAQKINPAKDITWPRIVGAGTPVSLSVPCSNANYGQPYQNTAVTPNTYYTCGTDGWAIRGGSGGGGLSGQTTNCAPKANSATTSTSSLPICDDGTTTTFTHPVRVTGSSAGFLGLGQGTSHGTSANTIGLQAPTSVTAYNLTLPSAQGFGPTLNNGSGALSFGTMTNPAKWTTTLPGQAQSWTGSPITFTQSGLTGDTGSGAGTQAHTTVFNDYYPGYDCGNGYNCGGSGWYLSGAHNYLINSYSSGIHYADSIQGSAYGSGDWAVHNVDTFNAKSACITPSDECFNVWRDRVTEGPEYTGTVVSGTTALTLTPVSNATAVSIDSPLVDTTLGTSGTVSITASPGAIGTGTTSFAVPVSKTGTLASNCDTPAASAVNTGLKLLQTSVTCTINTSTALSVGDLVDILGPDRNEVVKLTAVGALSTGVQSITALMYFSHSSGTTFYANGAVGYYLTLTDAVFQPSGKVYVEQIYGSTGANTIKIGHRDANQFSSFFNGISGAATMYPGADVVGVINPGTSAPDGAYLAVMPAPTSTFAVGDSVRETNNISAGYKSMSSQMTIDNPWANRVHSFYGWTGVGGGLNAAYNGHVEYYNPNAASTYSGAGGSYTAPYGLYFEGPVRNGIAIDHPFVGTGSLGVGASAANCDTWFLCVGGAPYMGQSTNIGIFQYTPNSDYFNYATDTHTFKLHGGGGLSVDVGDVALGAGRITSSASSPSTFVNTANAVGVPSTTGLCPNISAGRMCYLELGTGEFANDAAFVGFQHNGFGTTTNKIRLGFYGNATAALELDGALAATFNGVATMNSDLTVSGIAHTGALDMTGNNIKFGGTNTLYMDGGTLLPYGSFALGSTSFRWSGIWAAALDVSGTVSAANLSATNNITAQGNIQTITLTPATNVANHDSPILSVAGNFWDGASAGSDSWNFTDVLGAGANPTSTLTLTHSGSSGAAKLSVPSVTATTVATGTNTVYRCTTAGTLPVGALTIDTGSCTASADTGLKVN